MKPQVMTRCCVWSILALVPFLIPTVSSAGEQGSTSSPAEELRATETAFAQTMADRDHEAFTGFLADETVFFAGDRELRGKATVAEAWKRFFEGEQAPFSWSPDTVAVLDSGGLGLSSGPVLDPQGERIGTFSSTWRKEADGTWKIVFDKGCPPCNCGS